MVSIMTLNVGGVLYTTTKLTKDTLLKHESFFSGLLNENFSTTLDEDNNIFIEIKSVIKENISRDRN